MFGCELAVGWVLVLRWVGFDSCCGLVGCVVCYLMLGVDIGRLFDLGLWVAYILIVVWFCCVLCLVLLCCLLDLVVGILLLVLWFVYWFGCLVMVFVGLWFGFWGLLLVFTGFGDGLRLFVIGKRTGLLLVCGFGFGFG